jgi:DNA replication protein DnaC
MLNQQTMDKMAWMHLPTMTAEYRRQLEDTQISQLTFDERFGLLVDSEWTARQNKYLGHLIAKAGMRQNACLEDIDYSVSRGLERDLVMQLSSCSWIRENHNLLITGAAGTGKTFVACALGNCACRQKLKVQYCRVNRLLTDLAVADRKSVV